MQPSVGSVWGTEPPKMVDLVVYPLKTNAGVYMKYIFFRQYDGNIETQKESIHERCGIFSSDVMTEYKY